jgi:chromosome partitioning protein
MLTVTFANLKPGSGKTTCAVWLAHSFHEAGHGVLLVDADPGESVLQWAHLAGGFPFKVAPMPWRDLHKRLDAYRRPGDIVVIDSPQYGDHTAIARAAITAASHIIVPTAPNPIEIARAAPTMTEVRAHAPDARISVLLNRCVARANSPGDARDTLTRIGYHVLPWNIPRLEVYAQSFAAQIPPGDPIFWAVARELLAQEGRQ